MALSFAVRQVANSGTARVTNYGEYLEAHPPTHELEIFDNSSWSCVHGVERWRMDCGCNSGGHEGWNQQWREPLRNALDWLRDKLVLFYETKAKEFLRDPWAARDDYISVILDRSRENLKTFFAKHAARELEAATKNRLIFYLVTPTELTKILKKLFR